MAKKTIRYKGRRLSIIEVHGVPQLFIDDEHVAVRGRKRFGPYWARHIPYLEFPTLIDLGRAIVDYRALDEKQTSPQKAR